MAVNDRNQLAEVDAILQERIHRKLRSEGVTIVSTVNTYIEDGATVGRDTVIQPFSFIGRGCSVGPDCLIRSLCDITAKKHGTRGTVNLPGTVWYVAESATLNEN